jgi:hypothetical protein
MKSTCKECGGSSICAHGNQNEALEIICEIIGFLK